MIFTGIGMIIIKDFTLRKNWYSTGKVGKNFEDYKSRDQYHIHKYPFEIGLKIILRRIDFLELLSLTVSYIE